MYGRGKAVTHCYISNASRVHPSGMFCMEGSVSSQCHSSPLLPYRPDSLTGTERRLLLLYDPTCRTLVAVHQRLDGDPVAHEASPDLGQADTGTVAADTPADQAQTSGGHQPTGAGHATAGAVAVAASHLRVLGVALVRDLGVEAVVAI